MTNAKHKLGWVGALADDRKYVQFDRLLASSCTQVWAALTDPQRLADWFPGCRLQPWVDGSFDIWFGDDCEGPAHISGRVSRFEPPKVIEYGTMRYELSAVGLTSTRLIFSDVLHYQGPLSEIEVINSVLGGWHQHLDALEFALAPASERCRIDPRQLPEFDYSSVSIQGRD